MRMGQSEKNTESEKRKNDGEKVNMDVGGNLGYFNKFSLFSKFRN